MYQDVKDLKGKTSAKLNSLLILFFKAKEAHKGASCVTLWRAKQPFGVSSPSWRQLRIHRITLNNKKKDLNHKTLPCTTGDLLLMFYLRAKLTTATWILPKPAYLFILYRYCPRRLRQSVFSSLLRQPLQPALHGENLRPPGQRLPVPAHVEAPPLRSPHHSTDAPQRGGSLGVYQVINGDAQDHVYIHPSSWGVGDLERTPAGRTHKLHTEKPRVGIEPTTFSVCHLK